MILSALRISREVRRLQRLPSDQTISLQGERLSRLVQYARSRSAFYRALYAGISDSEVSISKLPVINKSAMMRSYDDFVTDPRLRRSEIESFLGSKSNIGSKFKGEFIVFHTSGATGERGLFAYGRGAWGYSVGMNLATSQARGAGIMKRLSLLLRTRRVASIINTEGHFAIYVSSLHQPRFTRLLVNRKTLSVLEPVERIVKQLNLFQPEALSGYTSMIELLAHRKLDGDLRINPRVVSVSAETLTDGTRETIRKAFGMYPFNTYAACESGVIAYSCYERRGMHLNSSLVILEPVDRDGQPVPAGKPSDKALLTNLYNYCQPIIRYEMPDSITILKEECPCGISSPLIEVEGKSGEILVFRGADGGTVPIRSNAMAGTLTNVAGLKQFQVVHEKRERLVVKAVVDKEHCADRVSDEVRKSLNSFLERNSVEEVEIEVETVDQIERDKRSGKMRMVVSKV